MEVRRAAIGDAWIFEYGEEKGDASRALELLDRRDKDGNMPKAIQAESKESWLSLSFTHADGSDAVNPSFLGYGTIYALP